MSSLRINPKLVIETGSNANGKWIKYADGTMICTKNVSAVVNINTAVGNLFYGAVELGDYPQNFIDSPIPNITIGKNRNIILGGVGDNSSASAGSIWVFRVNSTSVDMDVFITAIGRWK